VQKEEKYNQIKKFKKKSQEKKHNSNQNWTTKDKLVAKSFIREMKLLIYGGKLVQLFEGNNITYKIVRHFTTKSFFVWHFAAKSFNYSLFYGG